MFDIKAEARQSLINALDSIRGKKGLVVDMELSGPLSLLVEFPLLKEHGVDKIYHLQERLDTDCSKLIYMIRPSVRNMKIIADHIKRKKGDISIFMVPRKTLLCERILEEEGVYGDAHISEFPLDFTLLDDDVYSLELNDAFTDLYVRKDLSCIHSVAQAIMKLQKSVGVIQKIVAKGDYSKALADHLLRMRTEIDDSRSTYSGSFDSILILERGIDLVTPLCTQLTYQGLIDEIFGISTSMNDFFNSIDFVSVDQSFISGSQTSVHREKKVSLSGSDQLFSRIRDLNFALVGHELSQNARRLVDGYEERHHAKTVYQIKDFVGKLGTLQSEHQSLRLHTNLAEEITKQTLEQEFNKSLEIQQNFVAGIVSANHVDYIEELIAREAPFRTVLRLMCIYSIISGGLKPKQCDALRKEFIQTYGFHHLLTFDNLAKAGLFKSADATKSTYSYIKKSLRLIVDDINEQSPNDISYVYSGYAPVSIRLAQICYFKTIGAIDQNIETDKKPAPVVGWEGWEEIVKSIPGAMVEEMQSSNVNHFVRKSSSMRKTGLIVFLGGCTYTEIAAIRFLASHYENRDFLILTTNITNGNRLIDSLNEFKAV